MKSIKRDINCTMVHHCKNWELAKISVTIGVVTCCTVIHANLVSLIFSRWIRMTWKDNKGTLNEKHVTEHYIYYDPCFAKKKKKWWIWINGLCMQRASLESSHQNLAVYLWADGIRRKKCVKSGKIIDDTFSVFPAFSQFSIILMNFFVVIKNSIKTLKIS